MKPNCPEFDEELVWFENYGDNPNTFGYKCLNCDYKDSHTLKDATTNLNNVGKFCTFKYEQFFENCDGTVSTDFHYCSLCGYVIDDLEYLYCPHCGARSLNTLTMGL